MKDTNDLDTLNPSRLVDYMHSTTSKFRAPRATAPWSRFFLPKTRRAPFAANLTTAPLAHWCCHSRKRIIDTVFALTPWQYGVCLRWCGWSVHPRLLYTTTHSPWCRTRGRLCRSTRSAGMLLTTRPGLASPDHAEVTARMDMMQRPEAIKRHACQ